MEKFNTILGQLLQLIPRREFKHLVDEYKSDRYIKHYTTWNLFVTHLFSQIRSKDSLRDIETALNLHQGKWAHLGIQKISRSTIADANNRVSCEIFEKLFYTLLEKCQSCATQKKFDFENPLYALDASVIDLCLSVYDWATFRKRKGAIKLHALMDIKTGIPSFLHITSGNIHEAKVAQDEPFPLSPDSIVTFDRGYIDFGVFSAYEYNKVFFVTRAKSNFNYTVLSDTGQHGLPAQSGVLFDRKIALNGRYQSQDYPHPLRLVGYRCPETGNYYEFLTNNFKLSALTIAGIYKSRWQIELFFKWVKQHLKLKTFLGTSKNAVMSQIWIAMIYFLLLRFIQFQTKSRKSLLHLARVIEETLFERTSLLFLLNIKPNHLHKIRGSTPQLSLF